MNLSIGPVVTLQGEIRPPSDKSLTHRAYMLGAIANGPSIVRSPLRGEDCESTLRCLTQMGLGHRWLDSATVRLDPAPEWSLPTSDLDCGNSGTTMRLLSGLIASRPLEARLVGDASLSRRPMKRIAEPLRLMGARLEGDTPPIRICGGRLQAIRYVSPVASAQVKSCVLLAGLKAEGTTRVQEPTLSRDHTERMLTAMGCQLTRDGNEVALVGGQELDPFEFEVPADISSAAFFMVAAACLPEGRLIVKDLSVNPTRTGLLDVFRQAGIPVQLGHERSMLGEPVNDVEVSFQRQKTAVEIDANLVPRLIDEIPVLAVLATQCIGTTLIRGASELRVKESDRIETVAEGLRCMGAEVVTYPDGMSITGPTRLRACRIHSKGDHRIAMAFAVAGFLADGVTEIEGAEAIATSFPTFESELQRLCVI